MNWRRISDTYRGHTIPHVRFIERTRLWFTISGVMIAISLFGLFARQLNFSIDFEGGAQITYQVATPLTAEDVAATMADYGRSDAQVQVIDADVVSIRTQSLVGDAATDGLIDALAEQAGIPRTEVSVQDIGPTWGNEISRKALSGLVIVLVVISLYIAFRFEWKMAIGAVVALVHDVVITAGVYALVGREVTPETVIAILTILGYSLYDTVVIFDKVKENTESTALIGKLGFDGVVDLSLNQVLMRSVNTSLVVLLPILSLLLFGGETLKDFAFAMMIGVAIGSYSSVFVAAPLYAKLKGREPRFRQMEARRSARQAAKGASPEADSASAPVSVATSDAAATKATARQGGGGRPRPRSKRRPPAKRKRR